jgi:hypothetical protein
MTEDGQNGVRPRRPKKPTQNQVRKSGWMANISKTSMELRDKLAKIAVSKKKQK